jgi:Cys-tRNA(Pro)/Cys-tRNA(Cys) deacylase
MTDDIEASDHAEDSTPALDALAASDLDYEVVRHGAVDSLEEAARVRGVDPRQVLKTLVVRRGDGDYLLVLVPGDRQISWPKLREHLGIKRISMPDAETARDVTGYVRGTITPFGSLTSADGSPWPVIADALIASRAQADDAGVVRFGSVSIGGGAPGVSATLAVNPLLDYLKADVADVTDAAVIYAEPPYWNVTMDALESTDRLGWPLSLSPGAVHSATIVDAIKAAVSSDAAAGLDRALVEARRRLPHPTPEQVALAETEFAAGA